MVTAATRHQRRAVAVLLLLMGWLVALALPVLAQQGADIAIRSLELDADGTTRMTVSLPPGVDPEAAARGLVVKENANVIDEITVTPVVIGGGDIIAEVALLIDTSGSTAPVAGAERGALDDAKDAAEEFVATVAGEGIPVSLISFASEVAAPIGPTTDVALLTAAIGALQPSGDTALFDAVVTGSELLGRNTATRQRTIVLFTDGANDSGDDSATLEEASIAAVTQGVSVTSVSLVTPQTDRVSLERLAEDTGGVVFSVDEASELTDALGEVATSITSQLLVTWTSDNVADAQITVTAELSHEGQFLSDSRTARNVRIAGGTPVEPTVLQPRTPRLIGGTTAQVLGLGAAAAAAALLGAALFITPSSSRSAKVLQRQLQPAAQTPRPKAVDDVKIKQRVAAIMDAVPKPSGYDAALQLQLDQASWPLRSGEFLGLSVGLAVAGFIVGAVAVPKNLVLAVALAAFGGVVPRLILIQRRQKRAGLFHEQLPDTLQMLAGSLRAGYGLMQGLENVSTEGHPPTSAEFGRVLTETRLGIPLEDALGAMAERVGSDDFRWVTVAVSIQRKVGGNLAELLDTVATTLREREQVRRQVQVLSAEGKLSAVILIMLPIVFALYLASTRPEYLAPLFTTTIGNMMLLGGGVLLALGIAWIRNVIQIDV